MKPIQWPLAIYLAGLLIVPGCYSASHPWAGEPYRVPGDQIGEPQSVYAPIPSILPSIEAPKIEMETPLDIDLEALNLDEFDLDEFDSDSL